MAVSRFSDSRSGRLDLSPSLYNSRRLSDSSTELGKCSRFSPRSFPIIIWLWLDKRDYSAYFVRLIGDYAFRPYQNEAEEIT